MEYWSIRIEAVQSRFVRYALRFLPWSYPDELPAYKHRCLLLGMETLSERRITARAVFVKKLIDGEIDCPSLLQQVNINVRPRNLRGMEFLRIDFRRTNYGQQEPLRAMFKVFNCFYELYDFRMSTKVFKTRIRNSALLYSLINSNC